MILPASTTSVWPVISALSSDVRNTAIPSQIGGLQIAPQRGLIAEVRDHGAI